MSRTLIMGILNVTPDSFSDGGRFVAGGEAAGAAAPGLTAPAGQDHGTVDVDAAVAEARQMRAEGADIIDIGGESTRPGSEPTPPEEERRRILPVLQRLLQEFAPGLDPGPQQGRRPLLSVDTRRASTARAALECAGERAPELIINDVSGLLTDPELPAVVAEAGAQIVITHNRGDSKTMQSRTEYDDVVAEVIAELHDIRRRYLDAGVAPEQIVLDPGIGFAKTHEQNWELVRGLGRIAEDARKHGHRVLFGASRKGFLGTLLAEDDGGRPVPRPAEQRDVATAVLSAHAAAAGVWAVRVHGIRPTADALAVRARVSFDPHGRRSCAALD